MTSTDILPFQVLSGLYDTLLIKFGCFLTNSLKFWGLYMCTAIMILSSRGDYNLSQVSLRDQRKFEVFFSGFDDDAVLSIAYSKTLLLALILEFPNILGKKISTKGIFYD